MTPHHMSLVCGEQALITLDTSECFATKTFVTDLVTRMCLTCNRVWVGNGKGRFFFTKGLFVYYYSGYGLSKHQHLIYGLGFHVTTTKDLRDLQLLCHLIMQLICHAMFWPLC